MHNSSSPKPRLQEADRSQVRLVPTDLDRLVADDDQVRSVWAFVEGLDLSGFYSKIKAVEGEAGRPPIDPKILLTLWIQATLDGIGSAREIARLCRVGVNTSPPTFAQPIPLKWPNGGNGWRASMARPSTSNAAPPRNWSMRMPEDTG